MIGVVADFASRIDDGLPQLRVLGMEGVAQGEEGHDHAVLLAQLQRLPDALHLEAVVHGDGNPLLLPVAIADGEIGAGGGQEQDKRKQRTEQAFQHRRYLFRTGVYGSRESKKEGASVTVSRVLSWTIIYPGLALPRRLKRLRGRDGQPHVSSYVSCTGWGLQHGRVARPWVSSCLAFPSLQHAARAAVSFCCTLLGVASTGR